MPLKNPAILAKAHRVSVCEIPCLIFHEDGCMENYCVVPEYLVLNWNPATYTEEGWAVFNARLNPEAIGSHVFPDFSRVAHCSVRLPATFLEELERNQGSLSCVTTQNPKPGA